MLVIYSHYKIGYLKFEDQNFFLGKGVGGRSNICFLRGWGCLGLFMVTLMRELNNNEFSWRGGEVELFI